MTRRAEEFRVKACECEELAERTHDEVTKDQLLAVAQQWRELADQEERATR